MPDAPEWAYRAFYEPMAARLEQALAETEETDENDGNRDPYTRNEEDTCRCEHSA